MTDIISQLSAERERETDACRGPSERVSLSLIMGRGLSLTERLPPGDEIHTNTLH